MFPYNNQPCSYRFLRLLRPVRSVDEDVRGTLVEWTYVAVVGRVRTYKSAKDLSLLCDQMARLFNQYLVICHQMARLFNQNLVIIINWNLLNSKKLPTLVQNFAEYCYNPQKYAQVATFHKIWSHWSANGCRYCPVVTTLAFYPDDPSSNSARVVFCKKLFEEVVLLAVGSCWTQTHTIW